MRRPMMFIPLPELIRTAIFAVAFFLNVVLSMGVWVRVMFYSDIDVSMPALAFVNIWFALNLLSLVGLFAAED